MNTALPVTFELRALAARGKFSLIMHELNSCILNDPVFCFQSRQLDEIDDALVKASAPSLRPPFPTCMFELELPPDNAITHFVGVIVDTSEISEIKKFVDAVIVMELVGRSWNRSWLSYGIFWTDGKVTTFEPSKDSKFDHETHRELAGTSDGLVSRGCYALNAGNHVEHCDVAGVRRILMRDKGITGFQYKIVHVDPSRRIVRSIPQGGTHASPRWHMRRSHERRLSTGQVVLVKACSVGARERGAVVKDYVVSGTG